MSAKTELTTDELVPDDADCETHPDDTAVDRFAAAMKEKLAEKRDEGRDGWDDPARCTDEDLATMLIEHIGKGDPVDIGNFAMMLHQRGASEFTIPNTLRKKIMEVWL